MINIIPNYLCGQYAKSPIGSLLTIRETYSKKKKIEEMHKGTIN